MSTTVQPTPTDGRPRDVTPDAGVTGSAGTTWLPRPSEPTGPERVLRSWTAEEWFDLLGAIAAGAAIATLLFGRLTAMYGGIGWAVVAVIAFLAVYALLVSLHSTREQVTDKLATVLLVTAGTILFGTLVFVVVYTVARGAPALVHANFYVQTMRLAGPLDPLTVGGIAHAMVGTLIQISIALSITIPLGIATAVFLNEVGGPFARFVRTVSDAMTALPSVVAGLFVYASVILLFTHERSGFAASLAITVMMLPIVIRSADVVLRLVANSLREASYAMGSTRWKTVWHVVLPTARSGLATAVILGTARGLGETSPVLLTSGVTAVMNVNPFSGPMISMPLQVFDFVRSPEPTMVARGFGTAAALMVMVLVLFAVARVIGGRGPGDLSPRQRRRVAARSARTLEQIQRRHATAPAVVAAVAATPEEES